MEENKNSSQPSAFKQISNSIIAAFLGVQSEKNRQRDFSHGKPIHFIIAGIVGTILFILAIWGLVKLALHLAGI